MVVPRKSVYNCILDTVFVATLDALASPIHIKLKYNNVHDDSVIICADLYGERRIHKTLQHDQKKDK